MMNCPYCLSEVAEEASVCKICTRDLYLFKPMMAKVAELLKYATIVVSSLPLLIMYPFFQKYFDQGIMVGSVKG